MLSYTSPFLKTGMRNYCDILLLGSGATLFSILWSYFRVVEQGPKDTGSLLPEEEEVRDDVVSLSSEETGLWSNVRSIFDWHHLRDVWITMTKQRADKERVVFHSLLVAAFLISFPTFGAILTIFPLTERLYKWDYQTFSYFQSLSQMVRPAITGLHIAVVVKGLGLEDLEISLIGIVSSFTGFATIASLTSVFGFYMQMVTGSLGITASSGIRAFLTKHLPPDETSKVLCIMLTMDMMQPFVASYFMSSIFRATIDFYPTLQFHVACVLLLIALIILCSIDIQVRKRNVSRQVADSLTTNA